MSIDKPGSGHPGTQGVARSFRRITLVLFLLQSALTSYAGDEESGDEPESRARNWVIQTSIYTRHFNPETDHDNHQSLIGLEMHDRNSWLWGASMFDNSFGQPSQYVYAGKLWMLRKSEHWYVKVTGGLLHGYVEPYDNKIPFNGLGIAPAIIPALGYRKGKVQLEANLGGVSSLIITLGLRF